MKQLLITALAAAFAVAFTGGAGGADEALAAQNCLGWERDMRSAAGYDNLGRPAIDRLAGDGAFGHSLNDWVADNCMRLNYVQVLGTHNSYHVQPRPAILAALAGFDPLVAMSMEYTHRPLDQQLGNLGIRQIELDVFADPNGGLFAVPLGPMLVPPFLPDPIKPPLLAPGLKVLHVQDVDFETRCLTFVSCLQVLKTWSDANPGHLPLMVQVEAKDDIINIGPPLPWTVPVPFTAQSLDGIDAEIRSVFSADKLITPDDVRGDRATLEEAILKDGWPTLNETRGRFLFTLDNEDAKRAMYIAGHPSLQGRVLFTSSSPGSPEAAFLKINDPLFNQAAISQLVAAGYIVRTRADADTVEARFGLTARRAAALASGAQFVSTDYPEPDPDFGTGYFVDIPGGNVARCNPVLSPPGCEAAELEN